MALLPKLIELVLSRRRRGGGGGGGSGGGGYSGGGYRGRGRYGDRGGYGGRGREPYDPVAQQQKYLAAQWGKMVNKQMLEATQGDDLAEMFLRSAGLGSRGRHSDDDAPLSYEDVLKQFTPEDEGEWDWSNPLEGLME